MLQALISLLLAAAEPQAAPQPPPSPAAASSAALLSERDQLLDDLDKAAQELELCVAAGVAEEAALEASPSPAAEVVQRAERYAVIRERQRLISLKAAEVSRLNALIQANRRRYEQLQTSERQRDILAAAEKEKAELKARIEAMKAAAAEHQKTHAKDPAEKPPKKPSDFFIYSTTEAMTLRGIAAEKAVYDDESKWQKIYEANRDKISDPEALVPAGVDLVIPQIKLETVNGEP
ncbi:MAG: hypothetical protein RL095_2893 [Verrucomicrobiota bacterium]|jgi:nucleoid-associated protein YgaU